MKSTNKPKDSKDRVLIHLEAENWFASHLLPCPSRARPEELRYICLAMVMKH